MRVRVTNRQRRVKVNVAYLREIANRALPLCLEAQKMPSAPLPRLEAIEVTVLSDRAMARINEQFLNHRGPTDVITFDHGEILLGAESALENAGRFGNSLDGELGLYIVHGLLHLSGWSDTTVARANRMRVVQERVLASVQPD
jgi:probable rRNA maturation factor